MNPSVDVIIVNYNTLRELGGCLRSLHDAMAACVSQIVLVDNGSTDGSVERVRAEWPRVRVIALDRNLGFGAANNIALRQSQASHVLLLNSDTLVPAGAIDRLHTRLLERKAVAAGPRLTDATGRPEVSFGPMLNPLSELMQRWRVRLATRGGARTQRYIERHLARERFVDWVSGACLLLDRAAAEDAGFFDERYFMYEEDVDLCAALRARGGAVLYTPLAHVVHLRGAAGKPAPPADTASHYDHSHVAFYEKHAPLWAPWLRRWLKVRGRSIR